MPNTREKLVELICKVQDYGTKYTYEEWSVTVESKNNETVADHLIANGVTVQEWIPSYDTQRPPKEGEQALVYSYGTGDINKAVRRGKEWISTWDNQTRLVWISHWMPLPQPPKGE